jgi:hypothetical protein
MKHNTEDINQSFMVGMLGLADRKLYMKSGVIGPGNMRIGQSESRDEESSEQASIIQGTGVALKRGSLWYDELCG